MLDYQALWDQQQWTSFVGLIDFPLHKHPDCQHLSMLICGAALQLDDTKVAKQLIQQSMELVVDRKILINFILSVQQIQLAKVAFLAGNTQKALVLFQEAYQLHGKLTQPLFYDFLCESAEQQLDLGNTQEAIQTWQDIASILQDNTPEHVYHRMSHCYSVNHQGFGGTETENNLFGDFHKHDLLEFFHANLEPDFYFEIGVDSGFSLARAKGKALGVDARPSLDLKVALPESAQITAVSSDDFFRHYAAEAFTSAPDLAFIDGMHLFEFALRDFINLEKYAAPYALVGIDDIFPCHPIQAERRRQSNAWAGDVWKIIPVLEKYRPDLILIKLRCFTTGLLLIIGLDSENSQLQDNYEEILSEYRPDLPLPDTILQRVGSLPSDHPLVGVLVDILKQAKLNQFDKEQIKQALIPIRTLLNTVLEQNDKVAIKSLNEISLKSQLQALNHIQTQLFVPNPETGSYDEAHSIRKMILAEDWQEVSFEIEELLSNVPLRFDLSASAGLFEISEVRLFSNDNEKLLFNFAGHELYDQLKVQGDGFLLNYSESFVVYAYATDPIVIFPCIDTQQSNLILNVRMRRVNDGLEQRQYWQHHFK